MDGATLVARGAAATFLGYTAKVARPIALALFARIHGLDALGIALLVWAWVELTARVAGLGLDRGLQRAIPTAAPEQRPTIVAAALAVAALAGAVAAAIVAAIVPDAIGVAADERLAVQVSIGVMLPLLTVGVTALHAVRGTRQILALVWGKSVVEPVTFLLTGLAIAPFMRGALPVLVAQTAGAVAVAVVGALSLSRAFGLRTLARAMAAPRRWPLGEMLRFSLPLGVADVVNLALQRGDVIVVGVLSASPATTSAYAVAREIVTSLSKVRQGFDQVLAPVAAELHAARHHGELAAAATMSARWGLVLAAPLALLFFVFPELVLALFGVADGTVAIALGLLAIGRLVDVATGPTAVVLAMIGRPRLVLLNSIVGVAVAAAGAMVLGPSLGPPGVAAAASLGLVTVNALALTWLARLERLHPVNAGLAAPAAVVALAGLVLAGVRLAAGAALTIPVVTLVAGWLAAYLVTIAALGFLPAAWTPWRRAPVEVVP